MRASRASAIRAHPDGAHVHDDDRRHARLGTLPRAASFGRRRECVRAEQRATALEPDDATLRELAAHYRPHNERLFALLGRDLGWHDDPKYWYYAPAGRG